VSIVGCDFQVQEEPIGFVGAREFIGAGAWTGAWVGGLFGLLLGAAFLVLPGVGPVVIAGPLSAALLGGLEGALAGAAFGALSGALISQITRGHYCPVRCKRGGLDKQSLRDLEAASGP